MKKQVEIICMAAGSVWSAVSWKAVGAVLITVLPAVVTTVYGLIQIYFKVKREREKDRRPWDP